MDSTTGNAKEHLNRIKRQMKECYLKMVFVEWNLELESNLRTPFAGEGNAEERVTMLLVKRHTYKLVV